MHTEPAGPRPRSQEVTCSAVAPEPVTPRRGGLRLTALDENTPLPSDCPTPLIAYGHG